MHCAQVASICAATEKQLDGCSKISGLLLHLIVMKASSEQFSSHVILSRLYVDVGQEEPALFKLVCVNVIPVHLGDPFELVPGPRGLFEDHVGCGHAQQGGDVVLLPETQSPALPPLWSSVTSHLHLTL